MPKVNETNHENEGKLSSIHINSISLYAFTWIIDSGATDHITCFIDSFDKFHTMFGAEVNLPTGNCIEVKHVGTVKLSSELSLTNVLHIPAFKFNIISVSRLLQSDCCKLIFLPGQCVIQDTRGKQIGIATEENGLYILIEPTQSVAHSSFAIHCNNGEL